MAKRKAKNDFGAVMDAAMQKKGMSQAELAKASGVSRMHIFRILQYPVKISLGTAEKILKPLGLELQIVPKK